MGGRIKLYFDLMSQPARAVYMFFKQTEIPFESRPVALRKNEHHDEKFKEALPFNLVPTIDDNGFVLTESTAIMKYVIRKYGLPDHWFPHDLKKQARVEEYLHWHHFNTRALSANYFQTKLIIPRATGKAPDPATVEKLKKKITEMVFRLESYYLKDQPYLCGEEISIADIFCICELMSFHALSETDMYEQSQVVKEWAERVKKRLDLSFDDAHSVIYRARKVLQSMSKAKM